jgi:hypothetical protein
MKGDFTRDTFNPLKHFTRVLMQQGRVQLDADFNEQASILLHYLRALATDFIGHASGPVSNCGFGIIVDPSSLTDANEKNRLTDLKITPLTAGDFLVDKGRYYVDGILCENEHVVSYLHQPDAPGLTAPGQGNYLVYLDVWERYISFNEDDSIREVALGGPDTASRARVVWQVKLRSLDSASMSCADAAKVLQDGQLPKLRARVKPEQRSTEPCVISPESRYRGAENQLYRVEIHCGDKDKNGNSIKPTFKWSRENGSIVFPIVDISTDSKSKTTVVTLANLGRDLKLSVAVGDWVELVNDDYTLANNAAALLRVTDVNRMDVKVTLQGMPSQTINTDVKRHPLMRRWDQKQGDPEQGGLELNTDNNADPDPDNAAFVVEGAGEDDGWLGLEDGVQIQFPKPAQGQPANHYRTGDYWLIPARTATGDVEWPQVLDANSNKMIAEARAPHGIVHHYAPLRIISVADGNATLHSDCRCQFEPLRCAYGYHFGGMGIGADLLWPE